MFVGVCCRSCASQTNKLCTDSDHNLTRNKQSVLAKLSYTAPVVIGCSIQKSHFVDQCQKSDKQTYTQDQAKSYSLNNICVALLLEMYARLMHSTTARVWTHCCTVEWDHPLHCITLVHVTDESICMTESENWQISSNYLILWQSLLTLQ